MQVMDKENFQKSNLLRLGVSLNYSVFCYEILSDVSTACSIAKKVFEEVIKSN
jgi:14-3-3 protein epsilon